MTQTNVVLMVLAPLIMWRIYKRVQRLMVRQKSQPARHWIAAILLPVLLVVLALSVMAKPQALGAIAAGAAAGVALGVMALRRTRFEHVDGTYFYTPNAHIGLVIAMLFIGRLLYRAFEYYSHGAAQSPDFGGSPLTLLIFGIVGGYYATYGAGLLRWRRSELARTKTN